MPRTLTMTAQFRSTAKLILMISVGFLHQADGMYQDEVLQGRVLVQFVEGVAITADHAKTGFTFFDEAASSINVQSIEQAFPMVEALASERRLSLAGRSLLRVFVVKYSSQVDARKVARVLMRSPHVEIAEPQYVSSYGAGDLTTRFNVSGSEGSQKAIPNDSLYGNQRHLRRLEMEAAWEVIKGYEGNTVIAIVDGGTDWRHKDLYGNLWINENEIPDNGIDDDNNGYVDDIRGWNFANDSNDPTGLAETPRGGMHGTATAGIAAAVTNNQRGIAGSSWNAKFMPINVSCRRTEGACFDKQGVLYAAASGADVISTSFGTSQYSAIAELVYRTVVESGAVIVASAPNGLANMDTDPHYPASYSSTLSVSGTEKDIDFNIRFGFGRSLDVLAGGMDIDALGPGDLYVQVTGTSFAVPLVSGIIGLLRTHFPDYGPYEIMEQVKQTADPIEVSLSGSMGKGRVNAHRALTEESPPGIRMTSFQWENENGDSDLLPGENFTVEATFTNYGGDAGNLTVALEENSRGGPFLLMNSGPIPVGPLGRGKSVDVSFEMSVANPVPANHQALLFATITDGEFSATSDLVRLDVNIEGALAHRTEALTASITDQGNIGYRELRNPKSPGSGFRVMNGDGLLVDILQEGGLMIGTDEENLSDTVTAADVEQEAQHEEFKLTHGSELKITRPGALTSEYGSVELEDFGATLNPLGVTVLQESYVNDTAEHEDVLILEYTVTNANIERDLNGLWVGLFLDWDLSDGGFQDKSDFDDSRELGMLLSDDAMTPAVGVKVLTNNAGVSYAVLENLNYIVRGLFAEGFTDEAKWAFLSGGIRLAQYGPDNLSQVIGAGPFDLKPQQSAVVAFALIGGTDMGDIQRNADSAQRLWDEVLNVDRVSTEQLGDLPAEFKFASMYPNPGGGPFSIEFSLPMASKVELSVYNVLGQKVRTIVHGARNAGVHHAEWDGIGFSGKLVASGLYMARLTAISKASEYSKSQPLVIMH